MSLAETLLWLCKVRSPIGEERELCDRVVERLSRVRLAAPLRRYGDSIVVPLSRGGGGPHVAVAGHLDVVRTEHEGEPRIEGDRLYGPGAADMKSGLCLMLDLAESKLPPKVDVTLVFYAREEGPYAENELGVVLEHDADLRAADVAIALEPSDNKLQLGCGGSIHARVSFEGKTAHSARPWQGENAIQKAAGLLARLNARQPRTELVDGLEWKSVISATMASGGRARNIIPDAFELNVNQRFGPLTSVEAAEQELASLVAGEARVELVDISPAAPPRRDHPLIAALAASGVLAVEPKQAWTDVARFAALGMPAANFGPGVQAQAHQKNEWTNVAALDRGKAILARWLEQLSVMTALVVLVLLATTACERGAPHKERGRSDAVASSAVPSLLDRVRLVPALGALSKRFGREARMLVVDIEPERLLVQVEEPRATGRLVQYEYRRGAFGEPRPVELRGTGELSENLFVLGSVDLGALPDLLGASVDKVDPQDGRVKKLLIRRNLPDSEEVRVRVFVKSPRRDGYLDADAAGKPIVGH